MKKQITIREAVTENDAALFWAQLHSYYKRDMFPDPNAEERDYFLSDEYQSAMQEIHDRPQDRCCYLFFQRNGQDIGFALPVIYTSLSQSVDIVLSVCAVLLNAILPSLAQIQVYMMIFISNRLSAAMVLLGN